MENYDWKNKTIIIVEDEKLNVLLLEKMLIKTGASTIHAKNGREAVNLCRENKKIDLILMDVKMPVMDGLVATKLIKEFRPETPIIAQTAYVSEDDIKNIKESGFDDFIGKPIRQDYLFNIIVKYLE
ncbi:MAG: response regulator [Bacteroidales bacterium]|nr:response regulator [Bacteroidales bacterium]